MTNNTVNETPFPMLEIAAVSYADDPASPTADTAPHFVIQTAEYFPIALGAEKMGKVRVADVWDYDSAVFIVRACNNYYDLQEAARQVDDELVKTLQMMLRAFNVKKIDPLVGFTAIEKARAVIAKAKGQP